MASVTTSSKTTGSAQRRAGETARSKTGRSATPRILRIRREYGMPQAKFSRIVGVGTRTLSKLERGESPSQQVRRQVTEIQRLRAALAEVVKAETIGQWMDEPNKAFGGLKPIEVVERGEIDRLWAMIYDLRSGNPA